MDRSVYSDCVFAHVCKKEGFISAEGEAIFLYSPLTPLRKGQKANTAYIQVRLNIERDVQWCIVQSQVTLTVPSMHGIVLGYTSPTHTLCTTLAVWDYPGTPLSPSNLVRVWQCKSCIPGPNIMCRIIPEDQSCKAIQEQLHAVWHKPAILYATVYIPKTFGVILACVLEYWYCESRQSLNSPPALRYRAAASELCSHWKIP